MALPQLVIKYFEMFSHHFAQLAKESNPNNRPKHENQRSYECDWIKNVLFLQLDEYQLVNVPMQIYDDNTQLILTGEPKVSW